jgi:hypothetical protein
MDQPYVSSTPSPPSDLIKTDKELIEFLLPSNNPNELTAKETADLTRFNSALTILGPAAAGALVCPGNQTYVPDDEKCPYSAKCVLLKAQKAPEGELCPLEVEIIGEQFKSWVAELKRTAFDLSASERVFVAELVWLAVQEQRCSAIISKGNNARLTQLDPKEVHPETLEPITWEKTIHANVLRLDQISLLRARLLREWMLTPEQKAKQARWDGVSTNTDQASKQAKLASKIRSANRIDPANTNDSDNTDGIIDIKTAP